MSERFVFDPNNVPAFVDRWMSEVGNLYRGCKYNGWAMFNSNRELVDVYITDVNDKWVDLGSDPEDHPDGAWGLVLERIKASGATNVINVHAHLASEDPGPCASMVDFVASAVRNFDIATDEEVRFRGSIILHGDELDGALFSSHPRMLAPSDPRIQMAQMLLPIVRKKAQDGDVTAQGVLPVLDQIANGEHPPLDDLAGAIALMEAALEDESRIIVPPKPMILDPLGLPLYDPNDKRFLN